MNRARTINGLFIAGIIVAAGWACAALVAMTWGELLNWPDFVHTNYGFPLTFATHTTVTIVGPVNTWSLDLGAFEIDMAFWIIGMLAIFAGFLYLVRRETVTRSLPK